MSDHRLGSLILRIGADGEQDILIEGKGCSTIVQLGDQIEPRELRDAANALTSNGLRLASEADQHRLLVAAGKRMECMPAFTSNDNISPAFLKCTIAETLAQMEGLTMYSANVTAKPSELATMAEPAKIEYLQPAVSWDETDEYEDEDWDEYDEDDQW